MVNTRTKVVAPKRAAKEVTVDKKKGKRGKKICPECDSYVPIHSQKCHECQFLFHLNHKPKKLKLQYLGESVYTFNRSSMHGSCFKIILNCDFVYGMTSKDTQINIEVIDKKMQIKSQDILRSASFKELKSNVSLGTPVQFNADASCATIINGVKYEKGYT